MVVYVQHVYPYIYCIYVYFQHCAEILPKKKPIHRAKRAVPSGELFVVKQNEITAGLLRPIVRHGPLSSQMSGLASFREGWTWVQRDHKVPYQVIGNACGY
jgi:hypothetical protein